ncbi:hypothetical protein GUITHDRAFT_88975 [Guillardia theta CCMP2712]|uniref:SUI1 domain-containing protein n=1 Tax=Guillardia theta (strain CCMP2712) TaxID=905079 RepID=L1IVJ7_GUITC|nr:hypothetical protein GUITHDRAFT_88975 [Guillardia theta CCMP2712]EKX39855.1 hypothetical protein GUITHDRAFT_88975 [Guillardia theta CCMP2712]|mmetsp:Transcript_21098/g.70276  ORF Transcript_21098/g.70276 Transcript_21098/m.70276 type:complete len:230 (-) Transcript_21098:76-765(-)|eukprot:XP_005826835.1 hypothetical protein GUITHDRAFT_88975 [Guillardia theta CCMP2712]
MPRRVRKKDSSDEENGSDEEVAQVAGKMEDANLDSRYPLKVLYCGACSCPPEYCAWMGPKSGEVTPECKAWLLANAPELAAKYGYSTEQEGVAAAASGGDAKEAEPKVKELPGGKKVKEPAKEVWLSSKQRQKRKFVCTVRGLELFGIKLPDACKIFKKKFSTGAAVTETADNKEEIEIQGDVKDDLVSVIVKEFKIDIKDIFFVDGAGPKLTKIPAAEESGTMAVGGK